MIFLLKCFFLFAFSFALILTILFIIRSPVHLATGVTIVALNIVIILEYCGVQPLALSYIVCYLAAFVVCFFAALTAVDISKVKFFGTFFGIFFILGSVLWFLYLDQIGFFFDCFSSVMICVYTDQISFFLNDSLRSMEYTYNKYYNRSFTCNSLLIAKWAGLFSLATIVLEALKPRK